MSFLSSLSRMVKTVPVFSNVNAEVVGGVYRYGRVHTQKTTVDCNKVSTLALSSWPGAMQTDAGASSRIVGQRRMRHQENITCRLLTGNLLPQLVALDQEGQKETRTQTFALLKAGRLCFRHQGSHRVFLFRKGALKRLTPSMETPLRNAGNASTESGRKAIFSSEEHVKLREGDRLLIASSGIGAIHEYDLFLIMKNTLGSAVQLSGAIECALRNRCAQRNTGYIVVAADGRAVRRGK